MSSNLALWLMLLTSGNLLHYTSGSAITRQEHSIRGDIKTLDCDAIKEDPSKYYEMYWKVKGAEVIGYCNPNKKCWTLKSFLEDKRIQVVNISSATLMLSINRTLPQKTTGHTMNITCEVHTTDNKIHVSEDTIVYSLESSAITRQEHSIRGDIKTLDCDAIKKDPSKYYEMYWRVKGANGDIGYCNKERKCWKTKSQLLEDKGIQVVNISSSTLSIKRTLPKKTMGHTVTITCEVHKADNSIDISEVTIGYSLERQN